MTYGVVRAFQVIVNTFSEKAGVGGSRPWPPHFKALALTLLLGLSPLLVRFHKTP